VEGDLAAGQLRFQQHAVVRRAEQHRLTPQRNARLPIFQDPPDHEIRLVVLVLAGDQRGPLAVGPWGPEILGIALLGLGDEVVGRGQDRLRAAVVLLQGDDLRLGIVRGELADVLHGGRAE
jgi:hypothetical protein